MGQVIRNTAFYVFFNCFAGESGSRNTIYLERSSLAGFHAVPFVEQTRFYFIEEFGSFLVGKRFDFYNLSFLDADGERGVATKSLYIFTSVLVLMI